MTGRYITDIAADSHEGEKLKLLVCPACGFDFSDYTTYKVHRHIATHSPADFGLSEHGKRPARETRPAQVVV